MKKLRRLFSLTMCVILVFSCFACSDPGADIETVGRVSYGVFTVFIDQTVFTVDEVDSIDVHFKVDGAKEIDYSHPYLEKYTRSGWSMVGDGDYPAIHQVLVLQENGLFTDHFDYPSIEEPGMYRLTYTVYTTVDGTEHSGSFELIFKVV